MSKDAVVAFLKQAAQDPALRHKIVQLAGEHGYEFSVDELTDAELDQAAGGAAYLKFDGIKGEITRG